MFGGGSLWEHVRRGGKKGPVKPAWPGSGNRRSGKTAGYHVLFFVGGKRGLLRHAGFYPWVLGIMKPADKMSIFKRIDRNKNAPYKLIKRPKKMAIRNAR
jgi:hypothetical protein